MCRRFELYGSLPLSSTNPHFLWIQVYYRNTSLGECRPLLLRALESTWNSLAHKYMYMNKYTSFHIYFLHRGNVERRKSHMISKQCVEFFIAERVFPWHFWNPPGFFLFFTTLTTYISCFISILSRSFIYFFSFSPFLFIPFFTI